MQLFIKNDCQPTGTFIIHTNPSITYNELKQLVSDRVGICIERFQMMYGGKYIESNNIDEKTLSDLGITNEGTLYIRYQLYPKVIIKN